MRKQIKLCVVSITVGINIMPVDYLTQRKHIWKIVQDNERTQMRAGLRMRRFLQL